MAMELDGNEAATASFDVWWQNVRINNCEPCPRLMIPGPKNETLYDVEYGMQFIAKRLDLGRFPICANDQESIEMRIFRRDLIAAVQSKMEILAPDYSAPELIISNNPFQNMTKVKFWRLVKVGKNDTSFVSSCPTPPPYETIIGSDAVICRYQDVRHGREITRLFLIDGNRRPIYEVREKFIALSVNDPDESIDHSRTGMRFCRVNVGNGTFEYHNVLRIERPNSPFPVSYYDCEELKNIYKGKLMLGIRGKEVYCGYELTKNETSSLYSEKDRVVLKTVYRIGDDNSSYDDMVKPLEREAEFLSWLAEKKPSEIALSLRMKHWLRTPTLTGLVLPYYANGNLSSFLSMNYEVNSPLYSAKVRYIMYDIIQGLAALHEQDAVHLDLTLENIVRNNFNMFVFIDYGESRWSRSDTEKDDLVEFHTIGRKQCYWDIAYRSYQEMINTLQGIDPGQGLPQSTYLGKSRLRQLDYWCVGIMLFKLLMKDYPSVWVNENLRQLALNEEIVYRKNENDGVLRVKRWLDNKDDILDYMQASLYGIRCPPEMDLLRILLQTSQQGTYTNRNLMKELLGHAWFVGIDSSPDARRDVFGESIRTSVTKRPSDFRTDLVPSKAAR